MFSADMMVGGCGRNSAKFWACSSEIDSLFYEPPSVPISDHFVAGAVSPAPSSSAALWSRIEPSLSTCV